MRRAQKWRAANKIYHLHWSYRPETFQGVHRDSLGVGVIDIGCKSAPDRWLHRQEAPMRIPMMPRHFCILWSDFSGVEGWGVVFVCFKWCAVGGGA